MSILESLVGGPLQRSTPRMEDCPYEDTVERALWGGLFADRLGYAFAAGYDSALRRLFAHAGAPLPARKMCLAATESGGAHPRAMSTTLRDENGVLLLRGEKTFATLASKSDEMLVVATFGTADDGKTPRSSRKKLVVVRIPRDAKGVSIEDRPPTSFAPEIPHSVVRLTDVEVPSSAILPGDGWAVWVKPFRTIEDTHVLASTIGYLVGVARSFGWDRTVLAELVSHAASLVAVGARDPGGPITHVILAGLFSGARKLASSLDSEWKRADPAERERWLRDMPLLLIAENARTKRTHNAFDALA